MARRMAACDDAGIAQHASEDIGIEHAVHGDVIGAGFNSGDLADGIDQRLAMMRAGAADEGAIDIEEDEGGGGWHGLAHCRNRFSKKRKGGSTT